jgi:hypothetical protein
MLTQVKVILFFTVTALSGCTGVTDHATPKRLNDNYATNALLALKAIERSAAFIPDPDTLFPYRKYLIDQPTTDKIDAVDVLAVSDEEKKIVSTLDALAKAKVSLNQQIFDRDRAQGWLPSKTEMQSMGASAARIARQQYEEVRQDSKNVSTFSTKIEACFLDLDTSLRARQAEVPTSCSVTFSEAFPR